MSLVIKFNCNSYFFDTYFTKNLFGVHTGMPNNYRSPSASNVDL